MSDSDDVDPIVTRPQRRMLRRIFNSRTQPLLADGHALLTYKDALRHLATLPPEAREAVYQDLKQQAE